MRTLLVMFMLLSTIALEGAELAMNEAMYLKARSDVQLYPRTSDDRPADVPVDDSYTAPALEQVVAQATFLRWRHFVGDGVTFEIPDHPALVVRSLKLNIANPIFAQRLRTGPDQFEDGYAVDVDGKTVLTIMTAESPHFDDSICLCGAVLLQVFRFEAGTLRRFDLLANGEIKKAQALNRDHCATLQEWTHSRLHPDVYARIAMSLIPIGAALEEVAAEEYAISRYGVHGQLGLLRPGMERSALISRMGAPFREDTSGLTWRFQQGRSLVLTQAPMNDAGRFSGWHDENIIHADGPDLPEPYGSIGWVCTSAAALEHPDIQQPFIEAWALRLLPTVTDDGLNSLFNTLWEMTEDRPGSVSPALVQALAARFPLIGGHYAAWLLHEHAGEAGRTAMIARIEHLMAQPIGTERDITNLLSFIGPENPQRALLIDQLFEHPNTSLRRAAWDYADNAFTEEVLLAATRRDLAEVDRWLRWTVAVYWQKHTFIQTDGIAVLQAQVALETDEWVAEAMRKAIANQSLAPAQP